MPHARHAARKRPGSSSRHRRRKVRHKPRNTVRAGTSVAGITVLVGAAVASFDSPPEPDVTGAETIVDIPAIRELRASAVGGAARSERRESSAQPPPMEKTARPSPTAKPAPQPEVTITAEPTEDPAPAIPPLEGCEAAVPGDDVGNGQLTDEYLCGIGDGHRLRPDAAAAFAALVADYQADQGESLLECVTDSYRSLDLQVELKLRKPYLAAPPGTSNHGWGIAVDLACGMDSHDSALYAWLTANGEDYGWVNPEWALPTGPKPEPWHWEFDASLVG